MRDQRHGAPRVPAFGTDADSRTDLILTPRYPPGPADEIGRTPTGDTRAAIRVPVGGPAVPTGGIARITLEVGEILGVLRHSRAYATVVITEEMGEPFPATGNLRRLGYRAREPLALRLDCEEVRRVGDRYELDALRFRLGRSTAEHEREEETGGEFASSRHRWTTDARARRAFRFVQRRRILRDLRDQPARGRRRAGMGLRGTLQALSIGDRVKRSPVWNSLVRRRRVLP